MGPGDPAGYTPPISSQFVFKLSGEKLPFTFPERSGIVMDGEKSYGYRSFREYDAYSKDTCPAILDTVVICVVVPVVAPVPRATTGKDVVVYVGGGFHVAGVTVFV
jgi:hypothetical protein